VDNHKKESPGRKVVLSLPFALNAEEAATPAPASNPKSRVDFGDDLASHV